MTQNLYVTAKFIAKDTQVTNLISLLETLAAATRSEAGCIDYSYYRSTGNPAVFTSIEVWETLEAEAAHWQTPHIQAALTQLPSLLAGEAEVMKYHKII